MREEFKNTKNWHNRGYLPHYDAGEKYQFITYRLVDSLPQRVLKDLPGLETPLSSAATFTRKNNLGAPLSSAAKEITLERRKYVESHLDKGWGSCLLDEPDVAAKVIEAWKYFDNIKYDLIAYVVMPNHVHLLIKNYEGVKLGECVRSWKLFVSNFVAKNMRLRMKFENFAKSSNAALESGAPKGVSCEIEAALESGAPKKFTIWQREYWDRFIRDVKHFEKSVEYILNNPIKAGLCQNINEWKWAYFKG